MALSVHVTCHQYNNPKYDDSKPKDPDTNSPVLYDVVQIKNTTALEIGQTLTPGQVDKYMQNHYYEFTISKPAKR